MDVITTAAALIFSLARGRVIAAAAARYKHCSKYINYYNIASTKERLRGK